MNIIEEEKTDISLRSKKSKKNKQKNFENHHRDFDINGDSIYFIKRKRARGKNYLIEENENEIINFSKEENNLIFKIKEIYKKLKPKYIFQNNYENIYDTQEETRRKTLVNEVIKDSNFIKLQKDIILNTKNISLFCVILENFYIFSSYNNYFLIDMLEILDKLIIKSFKFFDFYQSISGVIHLSYLIFEYKLFNNEIKEKYINLLIDILMDKNKIEILNNINMIREKNYIFYIIYTLLHSSNSDDIKIKEEKIILFLKYMSYEINKIFINNNTNIINQYYEQIELLLKILDEICINENFINIYRKNKNNIFIIKDINILMNNIFNKIINNLSLDDRQEIIDDNDINFIVRFSMNIIIKNLSGINDYYNNEPNIQKIINKEDIYNYIYWFIIGMSYLKLDEKNYCWLLGIMEIIIQIPYYQKLFYEKEYQSIIINNLRYIFHNKINDYFKLIKKIISINDLFKIYINDNEFKNIIEGEGLEKYNISAVSEYLDIIQILIEKKIKFQEESGNNNNFLNNNIFFDKNIIKQRVELLYNSNQNKNIKNKCESILYILDNKIIK